MAFAPSPRPLRRSDPEPGGGGTCRGSAGNCESRHKDATLSAEECNQRSKLVRLVNERTAEAMRSGFGIAVLAAALTFFLSSTVQAWEPARVRASGVGYAPAHLTGTPRGRLMAERAAKIVATRNLARHLYSIPPTAPFRAYVPGVRTVWTRALPGAGAEATVETNLPRWRVRCRIIEW